MDGLIATPINVGGLIANPIDSTNCDDTNVLYDAFNRLYWYVDRSFNTNVMVWMWWCCKQRSVDEKEYVVY